MQNLSIFQQEQISVEAWDYNIKVIPFCSIRVQLECKTKCFKAKVWREKYLDYNK